MDDVPSAQSVGREFVRQYYTMLNERPESLHRFFSHTSSYVHGGVEKPGEEQPPVKGQLAIHQKIMSLGFKDCHAKIRQVDCQETVSNAVVIQVTGELSNNMGPMRRFMQTFVLARQSPKMFYVHNDIFRYQDEVFHDFDGSGDVEENQLVADETAVEFEEPPATFDTAHDAVAAGMEEVCEEQVPPSTSDGQTLEPPAAAPDVSMTTGVSEIEPGTVIAATQSMETVPSDVELQPVGSDVMDGSGVDVSEQEVHDSDGGVAVIAPPAEPPVQKPFSWASLAGKNAPSAANTSTATAAPKPQATIKPERKAESTTTANQPLPQRVPRSTVRPSDQPVISETAPDRKWAPYDGTAEGKGQQGSGAAVVPDNQQLFVGNLPHNVDDKELTDFFTQFGTVVDVKINRKGMTRDLPNFGFVSFDCPEAVSKALAAKPLMLYGKQRINVEEKKEQSELVSRPRGGAPRGGRGSFGPYRGGSYRGGRGAAHFPSSSPHVAPAATSADNQSGGGSGGGVGFNRSR
jgi:Ras GTPase-activating protein-binding protein 1